MQSSESILKSGFCLLSGRLKLSVNDCIARAQTWLWENNIPSKKKVYALWRLPEGTLVCFLLWALKENKSLLFLSSFTEKNLAEGLAESYFAEVFIGVPSKEKIQHLVFNPNITWPEEAGTGLLTSGTSGEAKVVYTPYTRHFKHAASLLSVQPMNSLCLTRIVLPLFHIGGLACVFRALFSESQIAFSSPSSMPCDWHLEQTTDISIVETQLKRWLYSDSKNKNIEVLKKIQRIYIGGGPCSSELLRLSKENHLPLIQAYGMSESGSQFAQKKSGENLYQLLPGWKIKTGDRGELCIHSEAMMEAYITGRGFEKPFIDGFLPTRDKVKVYKEGFELIGRLDRTIISGGETLSLEALEKTYKRSSAVLDSLAIAKEDADYGERFDLWLLTESPIQKDTIIPFVKNQPGLKRPDRIYVLNESEKKGLKFNRASLPEKTDWYRYALR